MIRMSLINRIFDLYEQLRTGKLRMMMMIKEAWLKIEFLKKLITGFYKANLHR